VVAVGAAARGDPAPREPELAPGLLHQRELSWLAGASTKRIASASRPESQVTAAEVMAGDVGFIAAPPET
jgi:hypothetical protein